MPCPTPQSGFSSLGFLVFPGPLHKYSLGKARKSLCWFSILPKLLYLAMYLRESGCPVNNDNLSGIHLMVGWLIIKVWQMTLFWFWRPLQPYEAMACLEAVKQLTSAVFLVSSNVFDPVHAQWLNWADSTQICKSPFYLAPCLLVSSF